MWGQGNGQGVLRQRQLADGDSYLALTTSRNGTSSLTSYVAIGRPNDRGKAASAYPLSPQTNTLSVESAPSTSIPSVHSASITCPGLALAPSFQHRTRMLTSVAASTPISSPSWQMPDMSTASPVPREQYRSRPFRPSRFRYLSLSLR